MSADLIRTLSPGQARVLQVLQEMERTREFGGLELKIEAGHIVIVRRITVEKFAGRDTRNGGGNGQQTR